ncbi:hypothetical protein F4780DRAFT_778282 [Xylariomycetidae sp. FL0641]|nr:hypothetical protein F4780DRAFT_778282 [Xylariomycetidae sp. FL0641]
MADATTSDDMSRDVAPDATPRQSFTCFPRLPIELRTLIWEAAMEDGRVLFLSVFDADKGLGYHRPGIRNPHVLLSVSREARAVARAADAERTETLPPEARTYRSLGALVTRFAPARDFLCVDFATGTRDRPNFASGPYRFPFGLADRVAGARNVAIVDRKRDRHLVSYCQHVIRARRFRRAETWALVPHIFLLHMPPRRLRESGLFAPGEDLALLDVDDDAARLRRFRALYRRHEPAPRPADLALLLSLAEPQRRRQRQQRYAQYYRDDWTRLWLEADYRRFRGRDPAAAYRDARWRPAPWDHRLGASRHEGGRYDLLLRPRTTGWEAEWARVSLASMPHFRVMLLLQVCHLCGPAEEDDQEGDPELLHACRDYHVAHV